MPQISMPHSAFLSEKTGILCISATLRELNELLMVVGFAKNLEAKSQGKPMTRKESGRAD